MRKLSIKRLALILFVATVLFAIGSAPVLATEFPLSSLSSTVSVLPHRSSVVQSKNRPDEPEGSGIAVFSDGYVATAAHVLTGADRIHVRLHDGRILPARVVGQDRFTDIALLKIDAPLTPFQIAVRASIGEDVCTIGNQFGLGLSVTCGVVSAVHRSNAGFNPIEDFVQTDAVVNPGASGGALVNEEGHLMGMLSGIFTKESDADIGVNFAVHGQLLIRVLDDLRDHGRVKRARSGMVVQELTQLERETWTGVRIVRVSAHTSAARAGLMPDDVIVTMAGRGIRYPSDVSAIVYGHRPGEAIILDVLRDSKPLRVNLTLDE